MSQHENTPQFIKQVPWYAAKQGKAESTSEAKGQRMQQQEWYDRGTKGHQATTFRKGACQNCGAMGHSRKQCTERPRKVAAKYCAKSIAPDDITKNLNLNWEQKRDRWNGYNPEMYKEVISEYNEYEQIRKRAKLEQGEQDLDKQFKNSSDPIELANLPTKNAKNKKFQGLGGVRNRQDYAKYLLNLDVNSDHFDPKSRSMKSYDNAAAQLDNLDVIGERDELINQDKFASQQVQLHNSQLSSVALPTLTQKIYKKIKQNNLNASLSTKTKQILNKYGETPSTRPLDIIEQNEQFINHIQPKANIKSRYEEDVLINDHLAVWGSWYNRVLGWGYACCHSTEKYSYCLGSKGKERALANQLKVKANRLRELQQLEEAVKTVDPVQAGQEHKQVQDKQKQDQKEKQNQKAQQEQEQEQKQK